MNSHMNLWFLPNSRFPFVLYLFSFTFLLPENLSRYLQRRNNQQRKCSGEKRKKITLRIRLWGWRSRTQDSSMWTHRLDRRHVRDFGHIWTWRFLISLYDMFLFIAAIIIIVIFMTVDEIVSVKTEPVFLRGGFFVFLTVVEITVPLILRSKTRICREINFCSTVWFRPAQ